MRNEKRSDSLRGRYGPDARRWKGDKAGYVAIHLWIVKHWGKADHCDKCGTLEASRYEWANPGRLYRRERVDWLQLCPSCHRKLDAKPSCPNGHEYTAETTRFNTRGHRMCRVCLRERRKYAKANKVQGVGFESGEDVS